MWRRLAAFLGLLGVLVVLLSPVSSAFAGPSGVAYVAGPSVVEATIQKTILRQDVSIDANSTKYINYTLPGWVESVVVVIDNATDSVVLEALDSNDSVVATATVVPLSSGYSITLPGSATKLALKNNLGSIWSGTVTIVVQATVKFEIPLDGKTITITEHPDGGIYGEIQLNIKQISGPPGYLAVREFDSKFDSYFIDTTPERSSDHEVETTGAGWSETVPFRVVAYVDQPGTYTHSLDIYFTVQDNSGSGPLEYKVSSYQMSVSMTGQGSGTGTVTEDSGFRISWGSLGIGIVAGLLLVLLLGRRG